MSKHLVINTEKSLYKPIQVEVNGQMLTVVRVTKAVIKELDRLANLAIDGDVEAAYKQLELFFGKKHKVFETLEVREVREINKYITTQLFKSEKTGGDQEKKAKEPGDKELAS